MRIRRHFRTFAAPLGLALAACAPSLPEEVAAPVGDPLPGLTAAELQRFRAGEAAFNRVFSPADGLGPLFNENQCSACHTSPATGGTGEQLVTRATRFTPEGACDPMAAQGGENVRTQATPLLRAHGVERQAFPVEATHRGNFTVPFLFGLGLVELVPEEEILRRADPDDADGDGISGRPGRDGAGRLGRFGRKADHATLESFTHGALFLEMGLTTSRHPDEGDMGGIPFPEGVDPAPDPEASDELVALLLDFMRFLAPPERSTPPPDDARAVARGEEVFRGTGCAGCHVPALAAGPSPVAALDRKEVRLYSDLLLHDMGAEMAGVCTPAASPQEYRTAPLMGLRHRTLSLLHDGRAHSIEEAIELHGGEAAAARERYQALPELDRHALLAFLRTL